MRKIISIAIVGVLVSGLGLAGISSAGAATRTSNTPSAFNSLSAKPNFVPPTDGGSSASTPSNPSSGSAVRQFCYADRVVAGFTTVWMIIGNVTKPVQVAVY